MFLNLIVLSVTDIEKSKNFYSLLGLDLKKEQHGNSPIHYACEKQNIVLELYPVSEKFPIEKSVRLGFKVENLNEIKEKLTINNIQIKETKGMISIEDPDGRKIYLN